jgi:flagellar biosynthesis/type III secretory pathway protein FliH
MSGFVPIQPGKSFHAGVLGGGAEASAGDALKATDEGDSGQAEDADSPDAEESAVALPSDAASLEAMLAQARAEGLADAQAAMRTEREALSDARSKVNDLIERVESSRSMWASEVRNVLGELVVVGVRSVVSESADLQEELLRDRFAEVGERLIGEQNVVVRVRVEDAAMAQELLGEREGWQVLPDATLSGGLVAESEGGKVDASLGSALTGLAESVQEWQDEGAE